MKITLPRLMLENRLSDPDRTIVQQALLASAIHKENRAHEPLRIRGGETLELRRRIAIVSDWMSKNDDPDRETQHGYNEGVQLDR